MNELDHECWCVFCQWEGKLLACPVTDNLWNNEDTVFLCPECNNPVEYEDFKS